MNFFIPLLSSLNKKSLGSQGENHGARFLQSQGYQISERNYRCKIGEIDLVARQGDRIIFFEIRTRREGGRYGLPEESVNFAKQRKLSRLASWYLKEKRLTEFKVSFAVLAVTAKPDGNLKFRIIDHAFTAYE